MRKYIDGHPESKIVLVGEALGEDEIRWGKPFVGYSGKLLDKMLSEAGLNRNQCFLTNVLHERSPFNLFYKKRVADQRGIAKVNGRYPHPKVVEGRDALLEELALLEPNIIVPMGDLALWAITGKPDGITKWRGSILMSDFGKIVPTFNPAAIVSNWPWRWIAVQDLRRVKAEATSPHIRKPQWKFGLRPSLEEALEWIESLRGKEAACDIETKAWQIACIGFATSKTEAFCIPIMDVDKERQYSYWTEQEEVQILLKLQDVLTDPTTKLIFQNGFYDLQYIIVRWGFWPNMTEDTMVAFHVCFPGLQKSLDFQSSIFCDYYCYWKDDGKEWNKNVPIEQLWEYNCTDCIRTFECMENIRECLRAYNLEEQYRFQKRLFKPVLNMMLRGVKIDTAMRRRLSGQLLKAQQERNEWLEIALGHPLNPGSSPQMQSLFYTDFEMKPVKDRKTKQPTTNDDALETIKKREPLLTPLCNTIQEIRSVNIFKRNFIDSKLDADDRARCTFNLTGTNTFRFSATKNGFGTGMNLQTISAGHEEG